MSLLPAPLPQASAQDLLEEAPPSTAARHASQRDGGLNLFTNKNFECSLCSLTGPSAETPPSNSTNLDSDINLDVLNKRPLIRKPTLVLGGEKDPFYGADNIRETARLIPNAELILLKDGGHAVVKTQTKAFESAILEFLSKKTRTITNHAEANLPEPA